MKKIFIFFFVNCSLLTVNCYSQSGWVLQDPPLPAHDGMWAIQFPDKNTGYACGGLGTIIKTTDSGANWDSLSTGTIANFWAMSFVNTNTGYLSGSIAAYQSIVVKTTDGGIHWRSWLFPCEEQNGIMRSLYFVNANTGYIGSDSLLMKTTNGGDNWYSAYFGPISSVKTYAIYFRNVLTGFAVGYEIFKTTNGGINWTTISVSQYPGYFSSICFVDSLNGYIAGWGNSSSSYVYKTTNGGDNWTSIQMSGTLSSITSITFSNVNTGIMAGGGVGGGIFRTTDGGFDWEPVFASCNFYAVCVCSVDTDIQFSASYAPGQVLKSTNTGQNWLCSGSLGLGSINSICFRNQLTGFAVGNGIAVTTNGGNPWLSPYQCTDSVLNCVVFASDSIGFAVGQNSIIERTNDLGATWSNQNTPVNSVDLKSVCFLNENTGYICGDQGTLLETTNSGAVWQVAGLGIDPTLNSICFVDSATGYIAGNCVVLKTTNRGINWNTLNTGTSGFWTSISFPTPNVGYITGNGNYILKTTNAGSSWTLTVLTIANSIKSLFFVNATTGYAVGGEQAVTSYIIKTTDGGENWDSEHPPTNNALICVFFIDDTVGYAAGSESSIMKTTTGGNPIGVRQVNQTVPKTFVLYQNYPNPFNPITKISFSMPHGSKVTIKIYDILGKLVKTLVDEFKDAGYYSVGFDAMNLASGVYFYRFESPNYTQSKKMVLVK